MSESVPYESDKPPVTIGWVEYVDFPEWGVKLVKAKTDTGARTSALDVTHLEEIRPGVARFDIALSRKNRDRTATVEAPIVRRSQVRSSLGDPHERWVVAAMIRLGGVKKTIELGLVNRKNMRCRMLLGRKALEHDFMVDPGRRYIFGTRRARRLKMKKASSKHAAMADRPNKRKKK